MLKSYHLLSVDMEAPVGIVISTSAVTFIAKERRPPKPFSSILDLKFIGALMIYAKVQKRGSYTMSSYFLKISNATQHEKSNFSLQLTFQFLIKYFSDLLKVEMNK